MIGNIDNHIKESTNRASAIAQFGLLAIAFGYFVMVAVHRPPLASMMAGSLLATAERLELLRSLTLWSMVSAALMAAVLRLAKRRGSPITLNALVAALWPLTLLPLCWYVFNTEAWSVSPVLLFAVTTAACGACVIRTEWEAKIDLRFIPPVFRDHFPPITLGVAITAYVVYVSTHTIINHRSLGTAAFDLGIQENTLWNTLHGDLLFSSLMNSHYLGVHTSFVLLLVAPIYALAPTAETLLILQSLVLGLAALPLYLLARHVLGSPWQALLLALLWLTHPAVGGANFYDFHPIAFAPLFLFTTAYFWWEERWVPFWVSIGLLLSVKEEMAIVVVLLGVVTWLNGHRRQALALVVVGAAAYLTLQHLVIPHFAGGAHSYSWYYSDMIPSGEGPRGLITTVVLNPLLALDFVLTQPKTLFLFQLFAPLAFLPFFTARGTVLISYGLAATLLASRPPLHQIGFQYALTLLALGFLGALLALLRFSPQGRRRALTAAVMLGVVTCFHYGMIWPRHHFTGGFHTIDFDYSQSDRDRYRELAKLIEQIPDGATVLASETIVPHVARRHTVETARYARQRPPLSYDVVLVHNNHSAQQRLQGISYLNGLRDYDVTRGDHFLLFTRRTGGGG